MDDVLRPKFDRCPARALCRGHCELGLTVYRVAARRGHGCIVQCVSREPVIAVVSMLKGSEWESIEVAHHAPTDAQPTRWKCGAGGAAGLADSSGTPRAHEAADGAKRTTEGVHPGFLEFLFLAVVDVDCRGFVCVGAGSLEE